MLRRGGLHVWRLAEIFRANTSMWRMRPRRWSWPLTRLCCRGASILSPAVPTRHSVRLPTSSGRSSHLPTSNLGPDPTPSTTSSTNSIFRLHVAIWAIHLATTSRRASAIMLLGSRRKTPRSKDYSMEPFQVRRRRNKDMWTKAQARLDSAFVLLDRGACPRPRDRRGGSPIRSSSPCGGLLPPAAQRVATPRVWRSWPRPHRPPPPPGRLPSDRHSRRDF